MFAKLLKYDTRAIFKYWWIGALISMCISVLGGVCIQIVDIDYTAHELIPVLAGIGIFFSIVGIVLLPLFTGLLILVRYYKHFFTDEGYLTFTLPVKKSHLIDSKLVSALIFNVSAILVLIVDVFLMLAIGIPEYFFDSDAWVPIVELAEEFFKLFGGYSLPYILIVIMIVVLLAIIQNLFVFACITFAASIVKKHKILMAIGVYYGVNVFLSFVYQIMAYGGLTNVFRLVSELNVDNGRAAVLFILICVLGVCTAIVGGLYLLVLYLLDRCLNLE